MMGVLLLLTSCSLESEHTLGKRCYLLGDEANTMISEEIKGKDGFYDDIILGEIVDYDFDKNFIIVLRNASEKAELYFGDHPLWSQQHGKDSIQYWIIDKNKRVVYGPLMESEFSLKRKELGVSKELKVNNVAKRS
jgi:hypothetical protein